MIRLKEVTYSKSDSQGSAMSILVLQSLNHLIVLGIHLKIYAN